MREVEVWGRLDGEDGWEEEVPEGNQEAPERAQKVVHLVRKSKSVGMEKRAVVEDGDKTKGLFI